MASVTMSETAPVSDRRAARLRAGQRVPVTIERLVFQGDGLGRLPDGRVIFVPATAPGDEVDVQVEEDRGHFVRGAAVGMRKGSPLRVEPPCRYFGTCGGCQWQHLGYPAQLDWKRRILEELLVRVGKLEGVPIAPIIDPGAPWEYRARAQFKVIGGTRPCIGFHQRETNRVVDIDRCPLLDPRLNALLHAMRHMKHPSFFSLFQRLREAWVSLGTGTSEILLSLFARVQDRGALRLVFHTLQASVPGLRGVALLEGDPRQGPRLVDWAGSEALHEQVGDLRFRIGGTAFFQVSGLAATRLTALVLAEAKLVGTERVLELYCGAGTFTVPLAKKAREVIGIETNSAAASDGTNNLRENGCTTGRIIQGQVEQTLPALASDGRWNLVLLDPPRQGCSRAVIDRLAVMRVSRVIYVSCDPSTLARDLGVLARAGYRCVNLHPIDLFPQTFHLETVAVLER
jgi:23S rRNA (uracil1939-C5)-methyltransferase